MNVTVQKFGLSIYTNKNVFPIYHSSGTYISIRFLSESQQAYEINIVPIFIKLFIYLFI